MSRKTITKNIAYDSQRNTFYVTLYTPATAEQGRKRTTRCYPTLEQAKAALDRHTATRELGKDPLERNPTVGQWLHYWLEEMIRPSREATTVHGYRMIVRNHLGPELGHIPLRSLTGTQIQTYLNELQEGGLCANTVRKHYCLLHHALKQACRQGLVSSNAAEQATPPASSHPTHHFYDCESMQRLFRAVEGTPMEAVVKLAGYLGLRRGEICGLKWKHVDRQKKIITIIETRTAVNGQAIDKGTKNSASIRKLGYSGNADLEALLEHLWQKRRRDMQEWGHLYESRDFVVCHDGGKPYQPDYLSRKFHEMLVDAGLPHVTLHGLRHSFASIAHSRNVSLYGISKALGHSSTATTTQIYMHLFDDTHLAVVQEVGRAITQGVR